MFPSLRRSSQALPDEEMQKLLADGSFGVFALMGDDGYPYALPVNYAYDGTSIWAHCALVGHKIDAVKRHDKASFCVVGRHDVIPESLSTDYQSVIAFGRVRVVEDVDEKKRALKLLGEKYAPGLEAQVDAEIERKLERTGVLEMRVELATGKESNHLATIRRGEA